MFNINDGISPFEMSIMASNNILVKLTDRIDAELAAGASLKTARARAESEYNPRRLNYADSREYERFLIRRSR